ncbi:MAG TPA: type II toxin-antitoxin system HicA family toxin [Terriglobales bacterium]
MRALLQKGWTVVSQRGSHVKLHHPDFGNYMFGFHDQEEIGPRTVAEVGKHAGLTPDGLCEQRNLESLGTSISPACSGWHFTRGTSTETSSSLRLLLLR